MEEFHALLRRQWHRYMGRDQVPAEELLPFLRAVSEAYVEFDTARKMVERALELSSTELHGLYADLRGVLHVLPDLIFRVDADDRPGGIVPGSTIMTYPALQALTVEGSPLQRRFRAAIAEARASQQAAAFEYELDHVTFELRLLPFVGSDLVGIVRDVADRKQAERDRLILGKLESTGILAGGIAHDFNNLLTSMLLNVDLARMCGPADEVAGYLATIRQGVLAAQVLTQQLITFARGGAGVREPIVLAPLLNESVPLALSGSNVRCTTNIADDLWPTNVDIGQIGQVVRNLVLNAREAMPEGGTITLAAENVVLRAGNAHGLPPGKYVRFSVADHGPGIPPEMLPKIFDPYFSTKMRGAQKGMGLGLTICHGIVQKHDGVIAVTSEFGHGATFAVYLPAVTGPLPESSVERVAVSTSAPSGRILVMDDEPMVRTVFNSVLRQMGYDAVLVADGRQAVQSYAAAKAEGRGFDAVILDLTVKGEMGGLDAMRELRKLDPAVRAVVMSGYSDDDVMRDFDRHGFHGRLVKPFDRDILRDVLGQVLGAARAKG